MNAVTYYIAGVDEAGRGPLAGPVYAAAVILDPARPIRGLRDSKQLTAARREVLAKRICERAIAWQVAWADVEEIDCLNILGATLLAMRRAVSGLAVRPALVQVDGNCIPQIADCCDRAEAVIGGDDTIAAISAASILAKQARDALMPLLELAYPGYQLSAHKGYATPVHLEALARLGPSPQHRQSFAPVREALTPTRT
ncbi:MAG: ribonuclease HII [Pseudomonadota bacterium]